MRVGTQRRLTPVDWTAVGLVVVAGAAVATWILSDSADAWMPNVATSAFFVAITIAVVERIVGRQRAGEESGRVLQVIRRVSGDFHTLATFLAGDYAALHDASYVRPPPELRALLNHFDDGLDSRDLPWPKSPRVLVVSKVLADHLEVEIQRHDRVLDHAFVEASYAFIRQELGARNMYFDEEDHASVEEMWRAGALRSLVEQVLRFLDVFEPYARRYLGADWTVTVSDHDLDFYEILAGKRPPF